MTAYGEGVHFISTASHGGFHLDHNRLALMHPILLTCSFNGPPSFEEDCSWCAVAIAFPELFEPNQMDHAALTFAQWYPTQNEQFAAARGLPPYPGKPVRRLGT